METLKILKSIIWSLTPFRAMEMYVYRPFDGSRPWPYLGVLVMLVRARQTRNFATPTPFVWEADYIKPKLDQSQNNSQTHNS